MMIDKDILEVIDLTGLPREAITEQIVAIADHMLKVNPRIASAADALRKDLQKKGLVK